MAARASLILALLHSLLSLAAAQQTVNVAQGKPANASTEYSIYPASSVTDGKLTWPSQLNLQPYCFHSADNAPDNWLRVYLGAVFPMQDIRVYYRSGQFAYRFDGTQINIRNSTDGPPQLCTTVSASSRDTNEATFSCPQSGSIVELRKDGGTQNVCEVQVFACPANTYGSTCTPCGQCQGGAACASTDGSCPAGCGPGWTGQRCDTPCQAGSFGAGCAGLCGQCPCDHVTGDCTGDCRPGWRGTTCNQTCQAGSFGAGCAGLCGQCPCHHVTGDCTGDCRPGWRGTTCNQTCSPGQFGLNCNSMCGSCRDNATCDHVTGDCPAGCQAGWEEPRCLQECREGTYGDGCRLQCGKCAGGEASCDKEDGTCRGGCDAGFEGALCQTARISLIYNQGLGTGIGIGIGVSCLLFVPALIVTVLFFRRRLRSQRPPQSTDTSVYYNTAQAQAEIEDKAPYESLEAATRNANVPSDYEEIRGNRRC